MAITIGLIVAAFVGVALLSKVISGALSRWLGWAEVAEKYPVTTEYVGIWTGKQSFYIGDFFLIDCLDVGADDESLYFAFRFPLQGFKNVQIPWAAISDSMIRGKTVEMSIDGLKLRLRQSSFNPVALNHLLSG